MANGRKSIYDAMYAPSPWEELISNLPQQLMQAQKYKDQKEFRDRQQQFNEWNATARLAYQESSLIEDPDLRREYMSKFANSDWATGLGLSAQLSQMSQPSNVRSEWNSDIKEYSSLSREDFPDLEELDNAIIDLQENYEFTPGTSKYQIWDNTLSNLQEKRNFVKENYGTLNETKLNKSRRYRMLEKEYDRWDKKEEELMLAYSGALATGDESDFMVKSAKASWKTGKEEKEKALEKLNEFQDRKLEGTDRYAYYYGGVKGAVPLETDSGDPDWFNQEDLLGKVNTFQKNPEFQELFGSWSLLGDNIDTEGAKEIYESIINFKPEGVVIDSSETDTTTIPPNYAGMVGGRITKDERPKILTEKKEIPKPSLKANQRIVSKDGQEYIVDRIIHWGNPPKTIKVHPVQTGTRKYTGKRKENVYIPWGEAELYNIVQ
tara:strand:+ start:7071 stop:8375 length:1305 start_codon:yes stop_codon:yes gene_type:complete